jgi:hypothetical protein
MPFNFKGRAVHDPLAQQNFEQLSLLIPDTKGDLLTASGTNVPTQLAVGANGTVLEADSTATTGLKWGLDPIRKSLADAKGDLFVASANDTVARLAVGADNTVLRANSRPQRRGGGRCRSTSSTRVFSTTTARRSSTAARRLRRSLA